MCHSTDDQMCSRRIFSHAGGRIVQCLHCASIGVEFGTSYLVFSESEFFSFVDWFRSVEWSQEHREQGRIRIRVRSEASILLSLTETELRSVSALLHEGALWVADRTSAAPTGQIPMGLQPAGLTVH
ncbi:MAG: DUF6686 family protein [Acidobacteriota bacterium]